MNRFGAIIRQIAFLSDEADRQRTLAVYLDSLSTGDRQAVCTFLTAPTATRRTQLKSLRRLLEERVGPELFQLSHAFTGDVAETIALLWPTHAGANRPVTPEELMEGLKTTGPLDIQARLASWLSGCDTPGRHAILRIATGTLRNPVPHEVLLPVLTARGLAPAPVTTVAHEEAQADLFAPPQETPLVPGEVDAVLLYIEQARTRPPTVLCTFAVWSGNSLVPIARMDAGSFAGEIASWAARHTERRFGPTREVSHAAGDALIATIAFDGVEPATRRRAGFVLRAPRILSLTQEASAEDAGDLDGLTSGLPAPPPHGY
jgi:hypothetical protein